MWVPDYNIVAFPRLAPPTLLGDCLLPPEIVAAAPQRPSASFAIVKFPSHLDLHAGLTLSGKSNVRPQPKMQQNPFMYDALETWQYGPWVRWQYHPTWLRSLIVSWHQNQRKDDDYPFLRNSLEFYFIVQEEEAHVRRKSVGVGTAKCVPLDIFTDDQYDLEDTTNRYAC